MRSSKKALVSKKVKVKNQSGLHARVAAAIVKEAMRYRSDIEIVKGHTVANAKSIMEILTLAATHEALITIRAKGPDATEAVHTIGELFRARFGEQ